jgi:hypothetical protein
MAVVVFDLFTAEVCFIQGQNNARDSVAAAAASSAISIHNHHGQRRRRRRRQRRHSSIASYAQEAEFAP